MGKNIDKTFIQSKMLNKSKGPAVHSLRAQADKAEYSRSMRKVLENTDNLSIVQAEVAEILTEDGKITGVKTFSGAKPACFVPEHICVQDVFTEISVIIPDQTDCRQQII